MICGGHLAQFPEGIGKITEQKAAVTNIILGVVHIIEGHIGVVFLVQLVSYPLKRFGHYLHKPSCAEIGLGVFVESAFNAYKRVYYILILWHRLLL